MARRWRALLAYKRGEPRVCAMVRVPSPQEEDRRRICRERKTPVGERTRHVNRIKGLLFAQGITGYEPLRGDRRKRLEEMRTGDGRALPDYPKAQIRRELDRLELLLAQIRRSRPSAVRYLRPKSPKPRRPPCSTSRALALSARPSCTRKGCSGTSTIADRSQPMPGLH
jgi:transposase